MWAAAVENPAKRWKAELSAGLLLVSSILFRSSGAAGS
jgi:hypothetical protein